MTERYNDSSLKHRTLSLLAILAWILLPLPAQEVMVNVTPVQQVLPPQAMLYVSDPGRYFTITLINNTQVVQDVYLGLRMEQTLPASGLYLSTSPNRQPQRPFTLSPGQTRVLTMVEMKTLFDHIPKNEVSTSPGLFDDYSNGAFGLLPEGQYSAQLIAYKWNPTAPRPVALSSQMGGMCHFTICYRAEAPDFLTPMRDGAMGLVNLSQASLLRTNPQFTWKAPITLCNPRAAQFTYEFHVVELLPGQQPDEAITRNPDIYVARELMVPMVTLPANYAARLDGAKTYVAQVKARQTGVGANMLDYVMLENEGRSPFILFRVVDDLNKPVVPEEKVDDKKPKVPLEDGVEFDDKKKDKYDVDYIFSLPVITEPFFEEGYTRKLFLGDDMAFEWKRSYYRGGNGERQDTVKIDYELQLFRGEYGDSPSDIVKGKPFFSKNVGDKTEASVTWSELEKLQLVPNDYIVARIEPKIKSKVTHRLEEGTDNLMDFAMSEHIAQKFFQCSSTVQVDNTNPTKLSPSALKGKTVSIGEYKLTIDEIESAKNKEAFKGKGHVEWNPLGTKVMVAVSFEDLKINTDLQVYAGTAKTYPASDASHQLTDTEVVDKLFSDWGIDTYIGDLTIPYAKELQQGVKGEIKDLAKKIDLSKYYKGIKAGKAVYDLFLKGEVKDLHLPIAIPKEYNKSPLDIQIVSMKFAADHAIMNIMGEFTLPDTKYTKNDILVFGAPRVCISPETLLPESGTVALLSDFTVVDPKSTYTCTFKSPSNVMEPSDGCFLSWHANSFEMLGIDVEMEIPRLYRDVDGVASKEQAKLRFGGTIADWDDMILNATMEEPFQVSGLSGFTFTAKNIVYDRSTTRNHDAMTLPANYNRQADGLNITSDIQWTGLFIREVGAKFPKAMEFGDTGDRRLELGVERLYYDGSGITFTGAIKNLLAAKTGKIGGWSFSLDKASIDVRQNDFRDCTFSGAFAVPLFKDNKGNPAEIGYECRIQKVTSGKGEGEYAYIFKTQQMEELDMDFFLAKAELKKQQTYFLVEATPDGKGKLDTKVELMLGGDITMGGADYLNKKMKQTKLPMLFEIPDVHFCGMRLANCTTEWKSKYESSLQEKARNAKAEGKELWAGRDFELARDVLYFSTGRWSFASKSKKLGPFEFSLEKYNFSYANKQLKLSVEGNVGLVTSIKLSAGAGFSISAPLTIPQSLTNVKGFKIGSPTVEFESAKVGMEFACCRLDGTLKVANSDEREGFSGSLNIELPGKMFTLEANGGYYKQKKNKKGEESQFTYGWFYASAGGKAGIEITPVKITRLSGGFYFNCHKNGTEAEPDEGVIGVVLGVGISTSAGESALSGDFDMTVVYDRKNDCLSTFLLQGKVQALDDLVNAKANILYQHDNTNQYLAIDITVDAKADEKKLAEKIGGKESFQSLSDLKTRLNSSYSKLTQEVPKGSLEGKMDDVQNKDVKPSKSGKSGDNLSVNAGATINLQFKVTMKEKGIQLPKTKWHLYIGEPDLAKRCEFKFLKYQSDIVTVDIGANGYICLGNELPNNCKLPDIPQKIRQFLNGGLNESGLQNADLSKAERAREQALKAFEDQVTTTGGGVMFGAQVYGYLDVDLGLFYLNAGATAGFDISIVKLPDVAKCVNFPGQPGYKGWYGYGQLYAYLYAKFGLRIDLGFWDGKFDVADAGLGGVFRMQGPRPSHFDGEARVKLRLFDGLVDINRNFRFACGEDCDLFVGNALDNFKLFGDLSIGYDNSEEGWAEKNKISPTLLQNPILYTEAPLKQPFRVLDETELARMKKNYDGDPSNLEMEASRTFIFRSDVEGTVKLYEYRKKPTASQRSPRNRSNLTKGNNPILTVRTFKIKGQNRSALYLDITQLTPNRYYMMEVTGNAKEIVKGQEVDPLKYNEKTNKRTNEPWSQTKTYYFATTEEQAIPDMPNLQDYVAIAYPSYKNKIVRPQNKRYVYAHKNDLRCPSIALTVDISKKAYQQGQLFWRVYDNTSGKLVGQAGNIWVTTGSNKESICVMKPVRALGSFTINRVYRLTLEYDRNVKNEQGRIETEKNVLADMLVVPRESSWRTGINGVSADYEKPFVGARINSVNQMEPARVNDYQMAWHAQGKYYNINDPYIYIAWLSNYAFIGGWEFAASRLDFNVTTAQSLTYTDKGGVYEGRLSASGKTFNAHNDWKRIRDLSVYDSLQWSRITPYPLPVMTGEDAYALSGLDRANSYIPSQDKYEQVCRCVNDMYAVYEACANFSSLLQKTVKEIDDIDYNNRNYNFTTRANKMQEWYQRRRGQYASMTGSRWLPSGTERFVRLQVPYYQFPLLWGGMLNNAGTATKLVLWTTLKDYQSQAKSYAQARGHENNSEAVFCSFLGKNNVRGGTMNLLKENIPLDDFKTDAATLNRMRSASFSVYRVNAYDIKNCRYIVVPMGHADAHEERFTLNYPLKNIRKK